MKILVTGSAGFIGSALSIRLLDRGAIYDCGSVKGFAVATNNFAMGRLIAN